MLVLDVSPAGKSSVAYISLEYCFTYSGTSGLVPTSVISPARMLNNCGNSSALIFLKSFPILVILLSLSTVTEAPSSLALTTIVLNLYILNILPYCVTLSCLKNTGPLESHFISIAIINIGNASTASIIDATTISNNLFTIKEALRLLTIL